MYEQYFIEIDLENGASEELIKAQKFPKNIPQDYIDFIKYTNGIEGNIGEGYIRINKVQEVNEINSALKINEFISGILIIGSDGGDEAIGIDLRYSPPRYLIMPFLFEEQEIVYQGERIEDVFYRFYNDIIYTD